MLVPYKVSSTASVKVSSGEQLSRYDISTTVRGYIQKFPDWVDNEINNNNKHSLKSNTKGYGGKIH
jgi:hypothetical protein